MKKPPVSAHESFPRDYLKKGTVAGMDVKIITRALTKEEAQKIFKRPHSKHAWSPWGGDEYADDEALIYHKLAAPCKMCGAATRNKHLLFGVCPDCDGRAEAEGKDPHRKTSIKECCGNCHDD